MLKSSTSSSDEFVFDIVDDYDWIKEQFEIIGIKMDIHKNGTLFLKELVTFIILIGFIITST